MSRVSPGTGTSILIGSVSLDAGTNAIGKVRLIDAGGTEVTESTGHSVKVTIVADDVGVGGGVQYTEGDTDASITGTAIMMEVGSNILQPVQGTVADGLLVNLGANNDVTVTGSLPAGTNGIGKLTSNPGVTIGAVEIAAAQTLATVTTVSALGAGTTGPMKAEDAASANGDQGIAIMAVRLDTPVANAGVTADSDYTTPILDNYRKLWVSGTTPEDTAHVAGEGIVAMGERRIAALATSSNSDGDWSTKNQTAEGASWATAAATATANGLSVANFNSGDTYTALTNSAQVIKASEGNLYGYYIYNPNSSATYVMIYNTAAASVTVGTTTPQMVFAIPATSAANLMFSVPIAFSNAGWSIAAATTGGGNTAPSTALEVMIWYK